MCQEKNSEKDRPGSAREKGRETPSVMHDRTWKDAEDQPRTRRSILIHFDFERRPVYHKTHYRVIRKGLRREVIVMDAGRREIKPEDYILSVLSPSDRIDAAFKIAREAFRKTKLTVKDIDNAVKAVRRKAYEEGQ